MAEFKKSDRKADLLLTGEWRLASVDEVKENLEEIKKQKILNTWDIARLLDGWVDGPGYGYHYAKEYKPNMGHMLLIKTDESRHGIFNPFMYDDVVLDDKGTRAALLLSVDDKIVEVMEFVAFNIAVGDTNRKPAYKNRKAIPN
ncbi:hypothetical protein KI387_033758 [Taxus chinensis]|uniref:Uncharacterized protein n=1 Tax=Taxus chinensis TaxID=29808 RepID=A0AA38BUQ9_TAXCH|nr:hypothetical protein KI387_033758 [Taxus chinensis]